MKPAVLFMHARGCDEMADGLLRRADTEIIVGYEEVRPYVEAKGLPCRTLWSFLTSEASKKAMIEGAFRGAAVMDAFDAGLFRNLYPQYDDAFWERIREKVVARLEDDFVHETMFIDALRACANQCDLRLVVVPQDICRDTKTVTLAAKRLGIPTLHLLHAFPYGATNLLDDIYADYIAVYSELAADIYQGFGAPRDRIFITGNPYWDKFLRPPDPALRARAFKTSGLNPNRPVIVYAITYDYSLSEISGKHTNYCRDTVAATLPILGGICRDRPETQVVIRPHPNVPWHIPDIEAQAQDAGITHVWVDKELPPFASIAMADLVLCTQSNFGLEALMQGVPVINLAIDEICEKLFKEGLGPLFRKGDAVRTITEIPDIRPAVESLLFDPQARNALLEKRHDTIVRYNGFNDDRSSDRFTDLLLNLVKQIPLVSQGEVAWPSRPCITGRMPGATSSRHTHPPLADPCFADRGGMAFQAMNHGQDARATSRPPYSSAFGRPLVSPKPIDRYENLELPLCETLPESAKTVAATGVGANHVLAEVQHRGLKGVENDADAAIIAEPVVATSRYETLLDDGVSRLGENGTLIFYAPHARSEEGRDAFDRGAWATPRPQHEHAHAVSGWTERGLRVALSRAGLVAGELRPIRLNAADTKQGAIQGWVVTTTRRPDEGTTRPLADRGPSVKKVP